LHSCRDQPSVPLRTFLPQDNIIIVDDHNQVMKKIVLSEDNHDVIRFDKQSKWNVFPKMLKSR
jgi:hypothetical protein